MDSSSVRSAITISEGELIRWALTDFVPRLHVLNALGVTSEYCVAFEVGKPVVVSKERETEAIDALLVPDARPEHAVAIEAKRLKVDASTIATQEIGKLGGLRKLAQQANRNLQRGFHRSYAIVFAVVDGREFSGGSWIAGGLTVSLIDRVRRAVAEAGFNQDVGVIILELRQPVPKEVFLSGGCGLLAHVEGARHAQEQNLTQRIRRYVGLDAAV